MAADVQSMPGIPAAPLEIYKQVKESTYECMLEHLAFMNLTTTNIDRG